MGRLTGKVAIVTGSGSGIGAATAKLMAHEGASVVVADINLSAAESVARDLDGAMAVEVDVTDELSVINMINTAVASYGGLDVLHNNATDSSTNALDMDVVNIDMQVFDRLVAVNLKGVVMGCKHAIPHMLKRGGGSIVNTASIEGFVGRGVRTVYGSCKAGVVQFSRGVAAQYGKKGIRCNAVAPGLVLTPALAHHYTSQEQIDSSLDIYPMPRLCTPEDIANVVLFLASDEAGYVNGAVLMAEGGATIYLPSKQFVV